MKLDIGYILITWARKWLPLPKPQGSCEELKELIQHGWHAAISLAVAGWTAWLVSRFSEWFFILPIAFIGYVIYEEFIVDDHPEWQDFVTKLVPQPLALLGLL